MSATVDGDEKRIVQLTGTLTHCTEFANEGSILVEDLYPMIILVDDVVHAEIINRDAPGIIETSIRWAMSTELFQELSGSIEYLNPMIVSIRNDQLTISIRDDARRTVQFTRSGTVFAECTDEFALIGEDADTVIARIAYGQFTAAQHCQTPWPVQISVLAALLAQHQSHFALATVVDHGTDH